jgi:hypothetical protein
MKLEKDFLESYDHWAISEYAAWLIDEAGMATSGSAWPSSLAHGHDHAWPELVQHAAPVHRVHARHPWRRGWRRAPDARPARKSPQRASTSYQECTRQGVELQNTLNKGGNEKGAELTMDGGGTVTVASKEGRELLRLNLHDR